MKILDIIPSPWRIVISVVLLAITVVGVGYKGYTLGELAGQNQVKQLVIDQQNTITDLNKKNEDLNNKRIVQYIDRVNNIEHTKVVYVKAAESVPAQFNLSNGWIYTHDQLALGNPTPDPNKISDESPSDVKDNVALQTITHNYQACEVDRARLHDLIGAVRDAQRLVAEKNRKANQ